MSRYALGIALLTGVLVILGVFTLGQAQTLSNVQTGSRTVRPQIVVFYANGCPDCARMEEVLNALLVGHPEIEVARYEIHAPGSTALLWRLSTHYKILATQVPVIFIGDKAIVGAGRAQEFALRAAVDDCVTLGCPSPLDYVEPVAFPWKDLLWLGLLAGAFTFFFLLQG